ncbi:nicotinamide-nucleotide amidase [Pseudidiomarina indica]|uniref:Nicotinamide-nucleotide amidase n=1 Tax=Pseudidiomarina indica TaxID=1159017 RepID=A0A1G6AB87_9GAMM|nr:CinA family protein [Pseudidiomarina indica]SDB05668.1 nicotinamide-nucleotide amidase [Pseudidiomarina indica]
MVSQSVQELAVDLSQWLLQRGWQVVTAESCTGGGIGYAMSAIAGSSNWFAGGFITYSNELKQRLVGVPATTLSRYGAVSAETAAAMAQGALQHSGADLAIAVTGVAGPSGGTPEKPVGLVWFGLAWAEHCITWSQQFEGDRAAIREATIAEALLSFKKIT